MAGSIALASTGIACTGLVYWLVNRRSTRTEKLQEMRKKMNRRVASTRRSATQTVIDFKGSNVAVSVNQNAKQSYSNITNASETSTAHKQMNASYYKQSIDNWLEYVPQPEPTASVSAPEVIVSEAHSCSEKILRIPDNEKPNDNPSELNSHPQQTCGHDGHNDKPKYAVQEQLLCQTTGDTQMIVENIPPQPNTHLEQPREEDANTDKPKYPVQQPSVCLATVDSQMTNDGTPSELNINLLQKRNDAANADKPTYRPLASLLSQATGDTLMTIPPQQTINLLQPRKVYANTNRPKTPAHSLFVSDVIGDSRLTVEDIYIEAMTLDAEIRINRRHLDDTGKAQLSKIMEFCRDALHEKLVLSSMEKRAHGKKKQHK